jgi:hypothetical protein
VSILCLLQGGHRCSEGETVVSVIGVEHVSVLSAGCADTNVQAVQIHNSAGCADT